jgi:hypothetical protein
VWRIFTRKTKKPDYYSSSSVSAPGRALSRRTFFSDFKSPAALPRRALARNVALDGDGWAEGEPGAGISPLEERGFDTDGAVDAERFRFADGDAESGGLSFLAGGGGDSERWGASTSEESSFDGDVKLDPESSLEASAIEPALVLLLLFPFKAGALEIEIALSDSVRRDNAGARRWSRLLAEPPIDVFPIDGAGDELPELDDREKRRIWFIFVISFTIFDAGGRFEGFACQHCFINLT